MDLKKLLRDDLWREPEDTVGCAELEFTGIDHPTYDKLLAQANTAGVELEGSTAKFRGCVFDWNYVAGMSTLYVTCQKKPFIVGCDTINEQVTKLINQAKEGI